MTNKRSAKLTPEQVLEIRELYWQQNYTQGQLCRQYNVSIITIGRIVRGESWKDNGGAGYHRGATEAPAEKRLRQAAEDTIVMQTAGPVDETAAMASLARLQLRMGLQTREELTDDLPRQASDLHTADAGRDRASDLPSGDLSVDQRSEAEVAAAGRSEGTGPKG